MTLSNEPLPGIGSGIAKCPFDPEDNATAIWVGKFEMVSIVIVYHHLIVFVSKRIR